MKIRQNGKFINIGNYLSRPEKGVSKIITSVPLPTFEIHNCLGRFSNDAYFSNLTNQIDIYYTDILTLNIILYNNLKDYEIELNDLIDNVEINLFACSSIGIHKFLLDDTKIEIKGTTANIKSKFKIDTNDQVSEINTNSLTCVTAFKYSIRINKSIRVNKKKCSMHLLECVKKSYNGNGYISLYNGDPLPYAIIKTSAIEVILGDPFILSFTGTNGVPPYTFSYTCNNDPQADITTIGVNNYYDLSTTKLVADTYIYSMTGVTSNTVTNNNIQSSVTVAVKLKPTATIRYSGNVSAGAYFMLFFQGYNGTPPYTFIYTCNGAQQANLTTANQNSYYDLNSMQSAGSYVYNITGVASNGVTYLVSNQSVTVTVT